MIKGSISKLLVILLVIAQIFMLTACNNNKPITDDQTQDTAIDNVDDIIEELPSEIKNIILIIGDGMGLDHITAGELMYGKKYTFANSSDWQFAVVNTDSIKSNGNDTTTTDSAASGTALATGSLTINKYVGKDRFGKDLETILDVAKELGKSTGIVTTDTLHAATPAAFSAHSLDRNNTSEIILSQIDSNVDLLCGDKSEYCTAKRPNIIQKGYTYCSDFSKIDDSMNSDKAYWQFYLGGHISKAKSATVELKDVAIKALDFLDRNEEGFVIMIEQAHPDLFSHVNDLDGAVWGVNSLNDTVDAILEWLGDRTDTAIIITSDHETGGLTVSSEAIYKEYLKPINGNGKVRAVYYRYTSTDHTASKVGVFIHGIEADFSKFGYYQNGRIIKNVNINDLMRDILANPQSYASKGN